MSAAIVTPNTAGRRKRRTRSQAQNERSKRRKVESSEKGNLLVGACFDKRFIGYGTWTATIDAYDPKTKKYTCRYVDGYLEFHTREKLEKYGLFRPEEGEVVEPNTNPDEHPALRPKNPRTNGTLAAATTEEAQSVDEETVPTTGPTGRYPPRFLGPDETMKFCCLTTTTRQTTAKSQTAVASVTQPLTQ